MDQLRSGDIIGFVSCDRVSTAINVGTFGVPCYSIHHVGIVAVDHVPLIYESTTSERPPCARTSKITTGVQAHTLADMLALPFYARIWRYPLRRQLYADEEKRLLDYLDSLIGRPYDLDGAIHAGGIAFSFLSALMRGENLASLFCSELCIAALVEIGVVTTPNASHWSPNKLVRWLVRRGICERPLLLK